MEDKLKLGLLGSVIDAQRLMIENKKANKIFLVPLVMSYHFVLEGEGLIEQHLQLIGKEKYNRSRSSGKKFSIWAFIKALFRQKSEVIMSLGQPLDALGNKVDSDGNSLDKNNHIIDIKEYFILDGQITENAQRENIYTKMIGDKIVASYLKNNVILTSHLIAYIAFQYLLRQRKDLNFYAILRMHPKEVSLRVDVFNTLLSRAINVIKVMEEHNQLRCADQFNLPQDEFIKHGLYYLGSYHNASILKLHKETLTTESIKLLYFYNNRLEGYRLDEKIEWDVIEEFKYLDKLELN
jgi:glycerol-3-phosphate O-acyltransferase